MAPHHRGQMGVPVRDGPMPVDPTPGRNRRQRAGETVLCRYLPHHILTCPRPAPYVGEALAAVIQPRLDNPRKAGVPQLRNQKIIRPVHRYRSTYWVGEAMGPKEYKEFKRAPKIVAKWTQMLASNTAHLARLLKAQQYPGIKGGR